MDQATTQSLWKSKNPNLRIADVKLFWVFQVSVRGGLQLFSNNNASAEPDLSSSDL